MKKKLTMFLTLALLFTMAIPAMANPFQDVPSNHWAYDSLNKVAQAGLIEGYTDGSFKGGEDLTRYQVAVLTGRVLDKIETEDSEVKSDVVNAINKLAAEFDQELAQIDERLTNLEVVTISGETGVEYKDVTVDGDAYQDPFNKDIDGDNDIDEADMITAEEYFKHYADLNVNIAKDGVTADLDLKAVNNYFGSQADENNFKLDSISGTVTTEDFAATIGDEQDLGWKDYLFAGEDNIDGVIFNAGDSTIALGQDNDDVKRVAAKQDNLFNLPVNAFAGVEYDNGRNIVVGADTAFNLAGIDLTGEVATSDTDLEGKLARVGASKDLGFVKLEGNYEYTDGLVGVQADKDFATNKKGYDVKATTELDKVELAAKYADYNNEEETTLTAAVAEDNPYAVFGVDVFGNYEYKLNSKDEVRYVEANKDLGAIDLAAIYDFEKNTDTNKADKVVSLAYAPEFDVAGIKLAPEAKVAAIYDIDNNQAVNAEAGVDATYEINDKLTAKAGYAWADKEDRVDIAGEKVTANAGVEYKVSEDTSATVNYQKANFTGENAVDSFTAESITGGVNVKF